MEDLGPHIFWDSLGIHVLLAFTAAGSCTVFMPPDGPDGEFSLLSFSTEPSAGPRWLGEADFLEVSMWSKVRWEWARSYITTARLPLGVPTLGHLSCFSLDSSVLPISSPAHSFSDSFSSFSYQAAPSSFHHALQSSLALAPWLWLWHSPYAFRPWHPLQKALLQTQSISS